jgi:hypothetical protein
MKTPKLKFVDRELTIYENTKDVWLTNFRDSTEDGGYQKIKCPYMNGENCQTNCALFSVRKSWYKFTLIIMPMLSKRFNDWTIRKKHIIRCGKNVMGILD